MGHILRSLQRAMTIAAALALPACGRSGAATREPVKEKAETEKTAAMPAAAETVPLAAPAAEPGGQWYRASLDFGAKLPPLNFFLRLPETGKGPAVVVNGDEQVEFTAESSGDRIRLTVDWNYHSNIEANRVGETLRGRWSRYTPLWGEVVLPFEATPIPVPDPSKRYEGPPPAGPSLEGNWDLDFEQHGQGWARLRQEGDVVTAAIRPGNLSDLRFLAGNLRGSRLVLSTFNGNSANVVTAEISSDGRELRGTLSMQNVWNESFTGRRVDEIPAEPRAHLKAGARRLTLPRAARVKGPALVIFFATWCPSCNDAFPYLVDLAGRFRPKGVQVVGLAYDLSEDVGETKRQLDHFRAKHRVDFDTIVVPTTPEKWAGAMPPELEGWDGFPVFAFLGADGAVRHVAAGWWSLAAPDKNRAQKDEFETWMAALQSQ